MLTLYSFKKVAAANLVAVTLAGCTTFHGDVRQVPHDPAERTIYSYDEANRCIGKHVAAYLDSQKTNFVVVFDHLGDQTRNPNDPTSGPLSQAGTTILRAMMKTYIPSQRLKIPLSTPQPMRLFFLTGRSVRAAHLQLMQKEYKANMILALSGGFTGLNQNLLGDGLGASLQAESGTFEGRGSYGRSAESGRIRFVLNLGQFLPNELLGSLNMTATVRRNSQDINITARVSNYGVGFTKSDVVADGLHNAQGSLIAASFFYLWAMALPGDEEMQCLYDPETSPSYFASALDRYENAPRAVKAELLQRALNGYLDSAHLSLEVDGQLGRKTWNAIRAAEKALRLPPHAKGTLGSLYAVLVQVNSPAKEN